MTAATKVFAIVAAVFFICFKSFADDTNDVSRAFGGEDAAAIIANADSVKAWRTQGSLDLAQDLAKWKAGQKTDFGSLDFYRKSGDPIIVSSDLAGQLSKALLDIRNYNSVGASYKRCGTEPAVVVTFSEGGKSVDVFFCFECEVLEANNVHSDFDRGSAAFLQIIKRIFPNDPQIQSIQK